MSDHWQVGGHEVHMQLRGMVRRGVVGNVDDTGDVQTVDLNTDDDVGRTLVEVHQPYGFASLPPEPNPNTLVLSVGGDQGHQIALHLWSSYRFGNLAPGESALYDAGANRVHVKAGGNIDILAAALIRLVAATYSLTTTSTVTVSAQGEISVTSDAGIAFTGPVTFNSPVTFNDAVSFGKDVTIAGNLTVGGIVTGVGKTKGAL